MEYMTFDNALKVIPWVVFLLTLIERFAFARKAGKSAAEALMVLLNTLKVEDKMLPDGTFSPKLVEKVAQVSKTLEVGSDAKKKVQELIKSGAHQDIKIGSINGKPIYLGQIGGILGIGGTLARKVRDIWRRLKS